jgi:hypothetical protein
LRAIGKPSNEQAAGDQAAGRSADIDAGHRRKARQRIEPVGERQHHDDRHGDGDTWERAADHADQCAGKQRQQVFPLGDIDKGVPE